MVVVGDDFDLASVDAALGVDFVSRHLGRLGDRRPGYRLRFRDYPDLDGVRGQCLAGSRRQQAERGSACKSPQ